MTFLSRATIAALIVLGLAAEAAAQTVPRPTRRGKKYTIKIDSSPQQAAIYLDDKQYGIVGYTPYSGKLVKGDYKLIIELQGYKLAERIIRVEKRGQEFFIPLEKQVLPGTIDVQAAADPNVLGAQVFVDGQLEGTAPLPVEVPAGRHLVSIRKEGFHDFEQWVQIKEGERVTIPPVLKPKVVAKAKGSLLVDCDVPDCEVYVDGQLQPDTTPTIIDNLDEGAHVLEVKKSPAVPWKQTVYVEAGQRKKVLATLASTMPNTKGGNIRVLSNVAEAEVWLDGVVKGKVPLDLNDVPAGDHLIEVKAKGYTTKEQKVTVNVGQSTILKLELQPSTAPPSTMGKIAVVSREPEAEVFIDGARIGTAPVEKDVPPGEHFVVVQRVGFAKFEQKVVVEAGQKLTVTAALRAVGGLRFLSNVEGAEVVLDGVPIGKTPLLKEDIDVGDHIVTFRMNAFYDDEKRVSVKAGALEVVRGEMQRIGATPEEIARLIRGLSSFGAKTVPLGRFTIDMGAGYPYWVEARLTTGVVTAIDVALGIRSYLNTWEFLGTARYRFFQQTPFSFALFGTIGGGGGAAGRNMFTAQAGLIASMSFQNRVTLSGRAYVDVWSDRLCGLDENDMVDPDAPDVCLGTAPMEEMARARELTGNDDLTDRDSGARLYLSAVIEAAILQKVSIFAVFEGAPFQEERAAHTSIFNGFIPADKDIIYNFKLGATLKF